MQQATSTCESYRVRTVENVGIVHTTNVIETQSRRCTVSMVQQKAARRHPRAARTCGPQRLLQQRAVQKLQSRVLVAPPQTLLLLLERRQLEVGPDQRPRVQRRQAVKSDLAVQIPLQTLARVPDAA